MTCLISGRTGIVRSEASEPAFLTVMWFRCSFENRRRHPPSPLADPNWRPEDCHRMNETACIEKSQCLVHSANATHKDRDCLWLSPLLLTFLKSDLSMISIKVEDKAANSLGAVALITGDEWDGAVGLGLGILVCKVSALVLGQRQQRQRVLSWMWREEWPLWCLADRWH